MMIGVAGILLILIITSGCIAFAGNTPELQPVSDEQTREMQAALYPVIYLITDEMDDACSLVMKTARELDGKEATDPDVRLALVKLRRDIPSSFEAGLFDADDTLISSTEDLGATMEIGSGKATHHYTEEDFKAVGSRCIVSGYTTLLHGDNGFTFTAAVYDDDGKYNGNLRVGIDTLALFAGINEYLRNEYGYTIWVTQENGLVIYDQDSQEIGENLISDTLYQIPSLQSAVKKILADPLGNASYFFHDPTWVNFVQTNTVWGTVSPGYGMTWKIVLSDNIPEKTSGDPEEMRTPEELKAFVEEAYVYAQKEGKEKALAAFNDPRGEFSDGELYIFAYDMDGVTMALPYQPGLIGTSRWFIEDPSGVKIMQRMVSRAQQGGGYLCYLYPNPDHNYAQEYKLSYLMPVDDTWFIGAGSYIQNSPLSNSEYIDWQAREDLTYQVRNMQYIAATEGIPSLTAMIKDPTSSLQIDGLYPFAVAENGTVLACSLKPWLDGTNQLGRTTALGVSLFREMISTAREGGGVFYCLDGDPGSSDAQYMLIYVEPADASVCVGSMLIIG